mgnify:CR=1 FL=1
MSRVQFSPLLLFMTVMALNLSLSPAGVARGNGTGGWLFLGFIFISSHSLPQDASTPYRREDTAVIIIGQGRKAFLLP